MSTSAPPERSPFILRVWLALASLSGLLAGWALLRLPAEPGNILRFGLTKTRLAMLAGVWGTALVLAGLLALSWVRSSGYAKLSAQLATRLTVNRTWKRSVLLLSLGLWVNAYLWLLTPDLSEPFTLAYFQRLQPLMAWGAILCAQTLTALLWIRPPKASGEVRVTLRQTAALMGVFLLLWLLAALTGLGVTSTDAGAGWYALGSPVMETQACLAWLAGMLYIAAALWAEKRPRLLEKIRPLRADLLISVLIWVAAFTFWNGLPLQPSWFAAPPRPPNYQFYPNSDAYLYDSTAQTLLTGAGFKTHNAPFPLRPLYALFLAALHALGGVDYEAVIWMQVAALALIPVLLYWVARQLHSRIAALIAAALLIFREANAIILGGAITTANAKLLMSDLPTTFGVMLFILLMLRWLQAPARRQHLALIAGGVAGAFMLIRPEFGVLLPFTGLIALLQLVPRPKIWGKGMALIALGLGLFLFPWVWRNYQITGTIFLDSPRYRADLFALRYRDSGAKTGEVRETAESESALTPQPANSPTPGPQAVSPPTMLPGESPEAFAERMAQETAEYIRQNPGAVAAFIANHFLNSQIQTVLYLPASWRLPDSALAFSAHREWPRFWYQCCSADGYIRRLPFWFQWSGRFPRQAWLFVAGNLWLIAAGMVSAWRRVGVIGLLPWAGHFGYTLINALVRNSGGRYILPVDWVGMLYFAIGLGQLSIWLYAGLRGNPLSPRVIAAPRGADQPADEAGRAPQRRGLLPGIALALLLLGGILPISEKIIPQRYPPEQLAARVQEILQAPQLTPPTRDILAHWQENGGLIFQGRALYPRFHQAGQGEASSRLTPFSARPDARVDFYTVGPFNAGVMLPQPGAPETFPNGADVVVFGCPTAENSVEAILVTVYDARGERIALLRREPFPAQAGCPMADARP